MNNKFEVSPGSVSYQTEAAPSDQLESFSFLNPEQLEARVETALNQIDFLPSAEVREAVKGFYGDHYQLAATIKAALQPGQPLEAPATDPQTPHLYRTHQKLLVEAQRNLQLHPDDLAAKAEFARQAMAGVEALFSESSLAITSLDQAEKDIRWQLANQVLDKINDLGLVDLIGEDWQTPATPKRFPKPQRVRLPNCFQTTWSPATFKTQTQAEALAETTSQRSSPTQPATVAQACRDNQQFRVRSYGIDRQRLETSLERAEQDFWRDARSAAQLEFHGSAVAGEVMMDGLMSRNEQIRRRGDYSTTNIRAWGDKQHHSNAIHFSESLPRGEYTAARGRRAGEPDYRHTPGTYGVPLADIVELAPFARNAQLATVTARRPAQVFEQIAQPQASTARIGSGQVERLGSAPNSSATRLFFVNPNDNQEQAPDQYLIPVTGADASNQHRASSTRVLFTYDSASRSGHFPDWAVPLGYNFPKHYQLKPDNPAQVVATVTQAQGEISQYVKYRDKYVLPLRRGVFSFRPEDSDPDDYPLAEANSYTRVVKALAQAALTAA